MQYRNRMVRDAWEVKCGKEEDEEARKECKERVICGMRAMRSEDNCVSGPYVFVPDAYVD